MDAQKEQLHDLIYAFMKDFIDAGDLGLSKLNANEAYLYFGSFVLRYEFRGEALHVTYLKMNEANELEGYSLDTLLAERVTDADRVYVIDAKAETKMEEAAALHFSTLLNRSEDILTGKLDWLAYAPKTDIPGDPMKAAIRIALGAMDIGEEF